MNQNTGQSIEVCQVFACSHSPFIPMEEIKLTWHIEKVYPEEFSRILKSGGNEAENPLPPSSTHQHPTYPKTLPTPTQSHTNTPVANHAPNAERASGVHHSGQNTSSLMKGSARTPALIVGRVSDIDHT